MWLRAGCFAGCVLFCGVARAGGGYGLPPRGAATATNEHSVAPESQAPRVPAQPRTSWSGDRLAVLGHVGIGAPAGAVGLDLDFAPIRLFAIDVGIGVSPSGPQFAVMPRLRLPIGTLSADQPTLLTLGAGPSFGHYKNGTRPAGIACLLLCIGPGEGPDEEAQNFAHAVWYNVELGLDVYPNDERGYLRITLGYGFIANDSDYTCVHGHESGSTTKCTSYSGQALGFFTLAYGFDL